MLIVLLCEGKWANSVVQGYIYCKICSVKDAKNFVHRSTGCRTAMTKINSNLGTR